MSSVFSKKYSREKISAARRVLTKHKTVDNNTFLIYGIIFSVMDMDLPNRKPTRLKEHDYSSNGAYFITICTHSKKCIFSNIVGAIHESPEIKLTPYGTTVDYFINQLNSRFGLLIDKYVIMPNHIHLIVIIDKRSIRESTLRKRSIISNAIGYLKMNASRDIRKNGYTTEIWQRSFHDHIIRNENDYLRIWNYIDTNPAKWKEDCFYVE